ncbi:TetR/AcrR family transcriptional regulator [Streptomyces sp. NPDC002446]
MTGHRATGTGLSRRRRFSDEETAERMLRAAMDMVNNTGLTVSLEHISFEDVIRDAGVSRSAVYRRWPYKDLFFSDLIEELARGASPALSGSNPRAVAATKRVILQHLDWLRDPGRRPALVAEVLRQGALKELQIHCGSAEWRTYIALHATFLSLPDGELRTRVQTLLEESERDRAAMLADAHRDVTELLGCRLRPELNAGFADIARLTSATMRGMVIMAPASPSLATHTVHANPFGAPRPADWSQPALAVAGIVTTFIEADPAVEFDDERIASVRAALTSHTTGPCQ